MYQWETGAVSEAEAAEVEAAFYRFIESSELTEDERPYLCGYCCPTGRVVTVRFESAEAMKAFRALMNDDHA